jgi:hypothetical protein
MNLPEGTTNRESQGPSDGSPADGQRKPYSSPRLRSLGQVNAITGSGPSENGARRKPQG